MRNHFHLDHIDFSANIHMINASAGTGKTFALISTVERILKLNKCAPEDILILSFSKTAKEEIEQRLLKSKDDFSKNYLYTLNSIAYDYPKIHVATFHRFALDVVQHYRHVSYHIDEQGLQNIVCRHFSRLIPTIDTLILMHPQQSPTAHIKLVRNSLYCKYRGSNNFSFDYLLYTFCKEVLINGAPIIPEDVFVALRAKFDCLTSESILINLSPAQLTSIFWKTLAHATYTLDNKNQSDANITKMPHQWEPFLTYSKKILSAYILPFCASHRINIRAAMFFVKLQQNIKEEAFTQFHYLGYDDVLQAAVSVIKEHRDHVASRYKYILIDEVQDTDNIQWNIIKQLTPSEHSFSPKLFLFGDYKQTIYHFRGADNNTIADAKAFLQEQECVELLLATNYRASPEIVKVINWMFCDLIIKRRNFAAEIKAAKTVCSKLTRYESLHWIETANTTELYNIIISAIYKHPNKTIGILCKTNHDALKIASYIQENSALRFSCLSAQTKILIPSILNLYETQSSSLINSIKYIAILPIFCISIQEAVNISQDEILRIHNLASCLKFDITHCGLASAIINLLSSKHPIHPEHSILNIIHNHKKGYVLNELESFCTIAPAAMYHSKLSKLAIRQILREFIHNDTPITTTNDIQIMTCHASKGREFDIVFNLAGAHKLKNQDIEETMQLLYVACTRAKKHLYIHHNPTLETSAIAIWKKHHVGRNHAVPLQETITSAAPISEETASENTIESSWINMLWNQYGLSTSSPRTLSVSSYTAEQQTDIILDADPLLQDTSIDKEFHKEPLQGRHLGILVHDILEQITLDADEANIRACITRHISHHSISSDSVLIEEIYKLVSNALSMEVLPEELLNTISQKTAVYRETLFFFKDSCKIMKGKIDVMFVYNDTGYILDWKTDVLQEYSKEEMDAVVCNRYKQQAKIYLEAIQRALPNIDKFVLKYIFLRSNNHDRAYDIRIGC